MFLRLPQQELVESTRAPFTDIHTGWIDKTQDPAFRRWTQNSHQLGLQITCGATVNQKLVKNIVYSIFRAHVW